MYASLNKVQFFCLFIVLPMFVYLCIAFNTTLHLATNATAEQIEFLCDLNRQRIPMCRCQRCWVGGWGWGGIFRIPKASDVP